MSTWRPHPSRTVPCPRSSAKTAPQSCLLTGCTTLSLTSCWAWYHPAAISSPYLQESSAQWRSMSWKGYVTGPPGPQPLWDSSLWRKRMLASALVSIIRGWITSRWRTDTYTTLVISLVVPEDILPYPRTSEEHALHVRVLLLRLLAHLTALRFRKMHFPPALHHIPGVRHGSPEAGSCA